MLLLLLLLDGLLDARVIAGLSLVPLLRALLGFSTSLNVGDVLFYSDKSRLEFERSKRETILWKGKAGWASNCVGASILLRTHASASSLIKSGLLLVDLLLVNSANPILLGVLVLGARSGVQAAGGNLLRFGASSSSGCT